jgi:hypothetical protein
MRLPSNQMWQDDGGRPRKIRDLSRIASSSQSLQNERVARALQPASPGSACRGSSGSSQARYSGGLELLGEPLWSFLGPVICCEQHVHQGQEQVKLPQERAPTRPHWSRLAGTRTSRIDQRIAELERLKLGLTGCISGGCIRVSDASLQPRRPGGPLRPVRANGSAPTIRLSPAHSWSGMVRDRPIGARPWQSAVGHSGRRTRECPVRAALYGQGSASSLTARISHEWTKQIRGSPPGSRHKGCRAFWRVCFF